MSGKYRSVDDFEPGDFRRISPRFQGENFAKNLTLVDKFASRAAARGCTASQLAIAWLVAQGPDVIPIPGTKKVKYLEENLGAAKVVLSAEEEREIRREVEAAEVAGSRGAILNVYADTVPL